MTDTIEMYQLTDPAVSKLLAAAVAKARSARTPMAIVIVNAGGNCSGLC